MGRSRVHSGGGIWTEINDHVPPLPHPGFLVGPGLLVTIGAAALILFPLD